MDTTLPTLCLSTNPANGGSLIAIKRGESGYYPIVSSVTADEFNARLNITKAQVMAMEIGSCFGWNVPGSYASAHSNLL